MRPFLPWPQQFLAPLAIFVALVYGMSLRAQAYEGQRYFLAMRDIPSFIREMIGGPFFADAQEKKDDPKTNRVPASVPPVPDRTVVPSVRPSPSPSLRPTPKPSPVASPESSVVPAASPTPVAATVLDPTLSPSPDPDQLALNLAPAKKFISGAAEAISALPGIQGFKLGDFEKPYRYDAGRLDVGITRRLVGLAGLAALAGLVLVARSKSFNLITRK